MASHEAELIQVVEKLEAPPDSLVFWAAEQAIEQLAVNRSDPEACLDAIEDSFKQPQGVRPFSDLNILVANVTRWRMEVRTWAQERQPDVIMIQETYVTEKQQLSMQHEMAQAGYLSWTLPAHPTQGGNHLGGIMVAARSDRNFRLLRTFGVEGKGYLAVVGRVGKRDIVMVTVYLETGVGLHGGANPTLMGDLIAFIRGLSVEWLIFGDFNMPVIEMEHTSIPTVVRGEVISVGGPTTLQGGEIDYGLASRSLVGSVTAQEDWEVPFRPHCALRVALLTSALTCFVPLLLKGWWTPTLRPLMAIRVTKLPRYS